MSRILSDNRTPTIPTCVQLSTIPSRPPARESPTTFLLPRSRGSTTLPRASFSIHFRLRNSHFSFVSTLTPDGSVCITGSSPNADVVTNKRYATRYEVEIFSRPSKKLSLCSFADVFRFAAPYMTRDRPTYSGTPSNILYKQAFDLTVNIPVGTKRVTAVLMDLGYSTHGGTFSSVHHVILLIIDPVHMNMRSVELKAKLRRTTLSLTGPQNSGIYPPGSSSSRSCLMRC